MASWHSTMKGHNPRLSLIFTLLTLSGFILLIRNITSLEDLNFQLISTFYKIQSSIHLAFMPPEIPLPVKVKHTSCSQFGQEPTAEEAREERDLLSSIAWPGPLVKGLPVELSSNPARSYFVIQGAPVQNIGDQLVVNVYIHNFLGQPKKHGGDFLIARLHSPNLGAGVGGKVHDHNNGNYTVLFPLLWAGVVHVQITMVHPSEAVEVLKNKQETQADRVFFQSVFYSGNITEATVCNLCLPLNEKPLCNYTDSKTGEPWYCYKPQNLSCDTRITHSKGGYKRILTEYEEQFFKSVKIKVPIPASKLNSITVLPVTNGQDKMKSVYNTSGYYFHDNWRTLNGAVIKQFRNSSAITHCLKGKTVYMFGDSTMRQWFEYLTAFVPNLKQLDIYSSKQVGPFLAVDSTNNILVSFRGHGPPIRSTAVFASGPLYVANELDRLKGGPNTVVLVTVWAHFSTFPIEVYIRRLRHIRKAVLRLLDRQPDTVVVIRTANLQKITTVNCLCNSDWFSVQIDAVLRAMFRGIPVKWLDAWEMTLAHHFSHNIHPLRPIIQNMIDLILSQICLKENK